MAADGGWWLCCGEPDAGFCGANGGSHGSNRSGALLVDFELVMMAAIVQEASGSTREAHGGPRGGASGSAQGLSSYLARTMPASRAVGEPAPIILYFVLPSAVFTAILG